MSDIQDMKVFVRVAELESLSAAGRDLRLTAAVVSSRIQRLENRLGVRLFNRTTRRVNITQEGQIYYEHCIRILNEIEQAEAAIAAQRDAPRGPLKVTVPNVFGRRWVAPLVPKFTERHPDVQIRLHLTDALSDMIEEQIDLAIRIAKLQDSTAIARRLGPNRRVIVAAPDYLDRHPPITRPEDLLAHNCLLLRFPGSKQYQWTLNTPNGPVTLPVAGSMDSNNGEILRDWALAGHGLALKELWEVAEDIREDRLRVVLPQNPPPGHGIHALYPHSRYLPPRVRAFLDFLVEHWDPTPPWQIGLDLPGLELAVAED